MNKVSVNSVIISMVIYFASAFLSQDLLNFVKSTDNPKMMTMLSFVIFILPILTTYAYSINVWRFWDKLTQERSAKYVDNMINLLVRHQKDDKVKRLIMLALTNHENRHYVLGRRYESITTLISNDKGSNLWRCVMDLANIIREEEVGNFKKEVLNAIKTKPLAQTHVDNESFVKLINEKAVTCMSYAGGYPTHLELLEALKPIFDGVSKDKAHDFLLDVERSRPRFYTLEDSLTRRVRYLNIENAYNDLLLKIREWIKDRDKDDK